MAVILPYFTEEVMVLNLGGVASRNLFLVTQLRTDHDTHICCASEQRMNGSDVCRKGLSALQVGSVGSTCA